MEKKPNFIKKAVNDVRTMFHKYEQTPAGVKVGTALITIGLITGVIGLSQNEIAMGGFCCNLSSLAGAASIVASTIKNRQR